MTPFLESDYENFYPQNLKIHRRIEHDTISRQYSDNELQKLSEQQRILSKTRFIGTLPKNSCSNSSIKSEETDKRRIYSFHKSDLTAKNLLFLGAKYNNPGLLCIALAQTGTDVNMVVNDTTGDTALHIACSYSFGNLNCIKFLMLNNAKVDIVNEIDGQTPLHRACNIADVGAVCLLLEKKLASVAKIDKFGNTAGDILKNYIHNNHSVLKQHRNNPAAALDLIQSTDSVSSSVVSDNSISNELPDNAMKYKINGFLASEKLQIETVSLLKIRQSSELDSDIGSLTGDMMRNEILRNYYFEREDWRRNPSPPVFERIILKNEFCYFKSKVGVEKEPLRPTRTAPNLPSSPLLPIKQVASLNLQAVEAPSLAKLQSTYEQPDPTSSTVVEDQNRNPSPNLELDVLRRNSASTILSIEPAKTISPNSSPTIPNHSVENLDTLSKDDGSRTQTSVVSKNEVSKPSQNPFSRNQSYDLVASPVKSNLNSNFPVSLSADNFLKLEQLEESNSKNN